MPCPRNSTAVRTKIIHFRSLLLFLLCEIHKRPVHRGSQPGISGDPFAQQFLIISGMQSAGRSHRPQILRSKHIPGLHILCHEQGTGMFSALFSASVSDRRSPFLLLSRSCGCDPPSSLNSSGSMENAASAPPSALRRVRCFSTTLAPSATRRHRPRHSPWYDQKDLPHSQRLPSWKESSSD